MGSWNRHSKSNRVFAHSINGSECLHYDSLFSTGDISEGKSGQYVPPFEFRKRQLIVAVTANSAECEKVNDGGFDEICSKPLTRADIHKVIIRNFQYE